MGRMEFGEGGGVLYDGKKTELLRSLLSWAPFKAYFLFNYLVGCLFERLTLSEDVLSC